MWVKKGRVIIITGVEAAHSLGDELLLDGGVPEVLHLVVRSARQVLGDLGPPVVQWHTFSYLHFPFASLSFVPSKLMRYIYCALVHYITCIWAVACIKDLRRAGKAAGSHVCIADLRVACRITCSQAPCGAQR